MLSLIFFFNLCILNIYSHSFFSFYHYFYLLYQVRHIGHEIRTPLNVVGVGVDMLINELELHASTLPDGVMEIVQGIQEASTASLEVINELLMFENLAAGLTTLECVPISIVPFLEQAMRQHFLPARSKDVTFELVPPTDAPLNNVMMNVDPFKVATVFRNLFSNAIKFTKKHGRVTVRADVKTFEGIEMLEVMVKDSGAGLSPENLGRLFGEGVQFNANELQGGGGSGLGLFVTKGPFSFPLTITLVALYDSPHLILPLLHRHCCIAQERQDLGGERRRRQRVYVLCASPLARAWRSHHRSGATGT